MTRRTFRMLGRRRSAEKVRRRRRRPRTSSELGCGVTLGRDRVRRRGEHFSAGPTPWAVLFAYSLGLFLFG